MTKSKGKTNWMAAFRTWSASVKIKGERLNKVREKKR
jgi:hypothetical protein